MNMLVNQKFIAFNLSYVAKNLKLQSRKVLVLMNSL